MTHFPQRCDDNLINGSALKEGNLGTHKANLHLKFCTEGHTPAMQK